MKSDTLPSFWEGYSKLDEAIRRKARKTYVVWLANPFHPSLRFKCINHAEDIWSVRITRSYRALGIMEDDLVTWFWIGNHDEYERYFG
ncbi:MAG: hypothetical protein RLZZ384_1082 [Pseudomonadota bacterium]|jgi:hypothetical protein